MEPLVSSANTKPNNQDKSYPEQEPCALIFQGAIGLHKGDRPYQQDQVMLLPHHHAKGCILGLVADGMGGKTGGRNCL